jgi:hypothetical protein
MREISVVVLGLFFLVASARAGAAPPAHASATEVPSYFAHVPGAKLYYKECNTAATISVVLRWRV